MSNTWQMRVGEKIIGLMEVPDFSGDQTLMWVHLNATTEILAF